MSKISEMTRDSWIKSTFPEWGTWLVEDIENEVVAPGNVAMWWLGCTGVWFKTPADTNITIDLWCGNGKRTHGDNKMKPGHQMANMCGGRLMQPNLRNVPFVIDPFAFKHVDAVLATHYHQDHMSAEWAAHVIQSGMTTTDENGKEIGWIADNFVVQTQKEVDDILKELGKIWGDSCDRKAREKQLASKP